MVTLESDHGDPGGPWNLSKKLRFLDLLMFRGRVGVFDPLNIVWGVCNLARSFGNSILIVFLFLKTSNGPLEPKLGHFQGNHSDPIDLGSLGHFFSNEKSTGYEASVDFAQENKICKKLKNFLLLPANGKCLYSKILPTRVWASASFARLFDLWKSHSIDHLTSVEWAKPDFLPCPMGMDSLNPEEEVSILKNGRSHVTPEISLHY